eukprot:2163410-Pyramimonas_sp.AAC.1
MVQHRHRPGVRAAPLRCVPALLVFGRLDVQAGVGAVKEGAGRAVAEGGGGYGDEALLLLVLLVHLLA